MTFYVEPILVLILEILISVLKMTKAKLGGYKAICKNSVPS